MIARMGFVGEIVDCDRRNLVRGTAIGSCRGSFQEVATGAVLHR
jgi:hypothetical protein